MSDKPSEYRHHDGTPGSSADRSAKTAVPDSFPASDPVATTPAVGVRAMDVTEMMPATEKPEVRHPIHLTARFEDSVTAKLAVEKLVRDIPLERACTELSEEGDKTLLEVTTTRTDVERVTTILRSGGGDLLA
ncbi:MAG: hypothetical protein K5Q68_18085 [Roseococcus sp.]|nr:hypothetical protein [Roseococcus sp.]